MAGILYAAVACGPVLLTSYKRIDVDFESTSLCLIDKIQTYTNTKSCFVDKEYVYHILVENGITYLCTTYSEFGKVVAYGLLNELHKRFQVTNLAVRAQNAREHEFDREFLHVLKELMETFSNKNPPRDQVSKLQNQVDDVVQIMNQNIEKVLERGDKIDVLVDKAGDLEMNSAQFTSSSKRLRRKMWWKNVKMWIIIILIVAVVLTIIILMSTNVIPV